MTAGPDRHTCIPKLSWRYSCYDGSRWLPCRCLLIVVQIWRIIV